MMAEIDNRITAARERAQQVDREIDALSFRLSGADPGTSKDLQSKIDQLTKKSSDLWAENTDLHFARCVTNNPLPAASAKPAPQTPVLSAAEATERRQAATRDLWRRVVGKVNEQRFGRSPDAPPAAKREGSASPKPQATKYDTKAIWKKATAG